MKPKHTPAPWKIETHNGKTEIWSDLHFVARLSDNIFISAEKHGYKNANAQVISASPDLLASASAWLDYVDSMRPTPELDGQEIALLNAMRDACAKARGES